MANLKKIVAQLLGILAKDKGEMETVTRYMVGEHDDPYTPPKATAEFRLLQKRAVVNVVPLIVGAVAQCLYVDSYRPGSDIREAGRVVTDVNRTLQWRHWQGSRLDSRQIPLHRAALAYGHSFAVTEQTPLGVVTRGLSPLNTAAIYADPANDIVPVAALHVESYPDADALLEDDKWGRGVLWYGIHAYDVQWQDSTKALIGNERLHGASTVPVTRFAPYTDLSGGTTGLVIPMIPMQDRLNQTAFDLLLAQTYSSTKVRWVSGMEPAVQLDEDGNPKLDGHGQPIPVPINHNASRFLQSDSPDTKFGTLDETPLGGFIESMEACFEQISVLSQIPPHQLLGQIANLSAEALRAAEQGFARKVSEIKNAFGESWERVFQLAAELEDDFAAANDYAGEVVWRDVDLAAVSQVADALGKMHTQLGIPARGLWPRVPNVTGNEISTWERMREEDDSIGNLATKLTGETAYEYNPYDEAVADGGE